LQALLPVCVIIFPVVGAGIYDLFQERSIYHQATYSKNSRSWEHIVVTGSVGVEQLQRLLTQLFHAANATDGGLDTNVERLKVNPTLSRILIEY